VRRIAAAAALLLALTACGALAPTTTDGRARGLASRLLSGDDVPAGFRPLPLVADVSLRWCGVGAIDAPAPQRRASEVLTSQPDDSTQADLTDTVLDFAPGDAKKFVAALRKDQRACSRPQVRLPDGMTIDGDRFSIALPSGGDEQLVTDVRGTARGPALRTTCGGALARIVVRRGDTVVVIDDAVAGLQLDTGLRDRLAQRAAEQAAAGSS
jgi:hypothetical protein